MPRLLLTVLFTLFAVGIFAQLTAEMFNFNGHIFDSDSIPVENAYMVNYRSLRVYATDEEGRFHIPVQAGDSIKIVHIAYDSKIIKACPHDTTIWLNFNDNDIEMVTVKSVNRELQYFQKNMDVIGKQLSQEYQYNYSHNFIRNPYAPLPNGPTGIVEFNLFEIIDRIKHARKKKKIAMNAH